MLNAGRSLTEPPGLHHSALALNSTFGNSPPTRASRRSGVLPISSSTVCPIGPRDFSALTDVESAEVAVGLAVAMLLSRQHSPRYATSLLRIRCRTPV